MRNSMRVGNMSMNSRAFICPWCESPAVAELHGTATWDGCEKGEPITQPVEFRLVRCSECGNVSLQTREDWGDGFEADQPVFAYPAKRRLSSDVPVPLHREFAEAQKCFSATAYGATVVMVRRVLEGVCRENNVGHKTLAVSLKELEQQGLIDGTLSDWATALRILGNEGAHYTGDQVSRNDAEDSLAFAEALLDHIYVLRKRFNEFKSRRASKDAS
jgi:hypothetical protein